MDPEEFGKRVRAARGYADMNRPTLATAIGMSEGYMRNVEAGKNIKAPEMVGLITKISQATGLPSAFFTVDYFAAGVLARLPPGEQEARQRLSALLTELDIIIDSYRQPAPLSEALEVADWADDQADQTPGEDESEHSDEDEEGEGP